FFNQLKPSAAEQLVAQAGKSKDQGEAEKLYRRALEQDANLDAARLGLARSLLARGELDEIDALLEPFSSEGEGGEEAQRIKAEAWLHRKASALGSLDELSKRQAAAPKQGRPRLEYGIGLAATGRHAEALAMLLSA